MLHPERRYRGFAILHGWHTPQFLESIFVLPNLLLFAVQDVASWMQIPRICNPTRSAYPSVPRINIRFPESLIVRCSGCCILNADTEDLQSSMVGIPLSSSNQKSFSRISYCSLFRMLHPERRYRGFAILHGWPTTQNQHSFSRISYCFLGTFQCWCVEIEKVVSSWELVVRNQAVGKSS